MRALTKISFLVPVIFFLTSCQTRTPDEAGNPVPIDEGPLADANRISDGGTADNGQTCTEADIFSDCSASRTCCTDFTCTDAPPGHPDSSLCCAATGQACHPEAQTTPCCSQMCDATGHCAPASSDAGTVDSGQTCTEADIFSDCSANRTCCTGFACTDALPGHSDTALCCAAAGHPCNPEAQTTPCCSQMCDSTGHCAPVLATGGTVDNGKTCTEADIFSDCSADRTCCTSFTCTDAAPGHPDSALCCAATGQPCNPEAQTTPCCSQMCDSTGHCADASTL